MIRAVSPEPRVLAARRRTAAAASRILLDALQREQERLDNTRRQALQQQAELLGTARPDGRFTRPRFDASLIAGG